VLLNKCVRFIILEGCVARRPITTQKMNKLLFADYGRGFSRFVVVVAVACTLCTCPW